MKCYAVEGCDARNGSHSTESDLCDQGRNQGGRLIRKREPLMNANRR